MKKINKIILSILLIVAVLVVLGAVFILLPKEEVQQGEENVITEKEKKVERNTEEISKEIENTVQNSITEEDEENKLVEENEEAKIAYNKTRYDNSKSKIVINKAFLFFEQDKAIAGSVFILKDGEISHLIDEVPIGIAGGAIPLFQETNIDNIVLLSIRDGDMGWAYSEYYYINIDNQTFVKVRSNNSGYLTIIDNKEKESVIEISFINKCDSWIDGKRSIRSGEIAILDDLILNDKKLKIIEEEKTLNCFNPQGIGSIYEPDPQIDYNGISEDLLKVYFTLTGIEYNNGDYNELWNEKFVFNINDRSVLRLSDDNLLNSILKAESGI